MRFVAALRQHIAVRLSLTVGSALNNGEAAPRCGGVPSLLRGSRTGKPEAFRCVLRRSRGRKWWAGFDVLLGSALWRGRVSPRSGRLKIAQQFTAGDSGSQDSEVRAADG